MTKFFLINRSSDTVIQELKSIDVSYLNKSIHIHEFTNKGVKGVLIYVTHKTKTALDFIFSRTISELKNRLNIDHKDIFVPSDSVK